MKSYITAYKSANIIIKIISAVLCIFGIVILLLFSSAIITQFTNIGTLAGIAGGIYSLLMGILMPVYLPGKATAGKIIYHIFLDIYCILVIFAAIISGFMISAINNTPKPDSTAPVIVLGCQVRPDGTPSLMLKRRINTAAEYLSAHPDTICIVSGGKGGNEPESEAQVMYEELIKLGIDSDRIKKEDTSDNTLENIRFSKKIINTDGNTHTDVIIITDGFHQLRAKLMAKGEGLTATAVSADTPGYLLPLYWVREWLAICHFLVFGG